MKKLLTMIGAAAVAVGTAFDAIATELVTNGSFETYTGTISKNSGMWQYLGDGISFDGWTTAGGVGITTAADTTWKGGLARGNYTCFLQNIGSLTNTFNVTESGTHQVSFVYAARSASYKNGIIHIEIDGIEVGQVNCGSSQTYRFALMETEISAGSHILTIRHDNSQQNTACSTIDAVSIKPKSTRIVCNGGFEDYTGTFPVGTDKYCAGYNSASCYAYGWETSDSYGLSAAGSPYLSGAGGSPFEGYTALHFNGLEEINQNVVIPEDGVYEISFAYAPRDKTHYAGGRVNVWIDDEKVGYADSDPITTKFRRCRVRTQIAAGTHVFKLSHTLDHPVSGSNTPCTAVDDVSIVKVDDGNLIANGGFENYIGTLSGIQPGFGDSFRLDGWKYETSGEGLATTNSNYLAETKGSPFEGNVSLYFNSGSSHLEHSVSQTVYVAESGDYEMSFVYAPRDKTYYYGGRIWVLVDGEEVGEYADCDNSTTAFRRHAFRMPLSSGLHVSELKHGEGESIGGNYACSAIDDVALKAVDAMLMNGSFDLGTVAANDGVHSSHTVAGYSNPGWNCSGNVGLSKPGAAHVPSTLDVGTYALYMQTANYLDGSTLRESDDAYAWQSFSVATAGCYSVSFHYAKRANPYVNKMANVRVRRGVGTDGDIVFDKQFTASNSSSFDDFTGKVTLREPGTYTLEFFVPKPDYATSRNDGSVIIDDVSINWYSNIMGIIISVF